tara:strand:+ start:483 stop:851 length:369 start_codon:yes stop_codon:yes gene_type:complete
VAVAATLGFSGITMAESRCTNNGSRTRSSAKWTKNVLARFAGLVILLTTAEIDMEKMPDIGDLVIPREKEAAHLKLGVVIDLHDWGFDPQADVHVVEFQVAWNTGSTYSHYEWELEVIDVET